MKYNVGDKVRVRNDLRTGVSYKMADGKFSDSFTPLMEKFRGEIVTIVRADKKYMIEGDCHRWVDEMFEPVNDQKIVITTDGTETLARLYDGKNVVKTATAKCSPDDTFDFATGAKLAFERLMNKEKPKEKPLKFEIGKQYQRDDFVIEITKAEIMAHDVRYRYKTIKGDAGTITFFDENSDFGKKLKPYEPPKYFNGKVVCIKKGLDLTVGKVYEFVDGKLIDDTGDYRPCSDNPNTRTKNLDDGWARGKFIPFVE